MKIYGIGTDISNINRTKKNLKNKNFIHKVFNKNEINKCNNQVNKANTIVAIPKPIPVEPPVINAVLLFKSFMEVSYTFPNQLVKATDSHQIHQLFCALSSINLSGSRWFRLSDEVTIIQSSK